MKLAQTIDVTPEIAIEVYDRGEGAYEVVCGADKIIVRALSNYEAAFVSQLTQFHREMRLKHGAA